MADIGRKAYEIYAKYHNVYNNVEVESWEDLEDSEQNAWEAVERDLQTDASATGETEIHGDEPPVG